MRATLDPDSSARWRKSTYSNGDGGNCVEVAGAIPGAVSVRDSKAPGRPALTFGAGAWTSFLADLNGDRPASA